MTLHKLLIVLSLNIMISNAAYHGPIGVMGDHTHCCEHKMFSLRHMTMDMGTNRLNSSILAPQEVNTLGYMMAPVKMSMKMEMYGFMLSDENQITWMLMVPDLNKEMTMRMPNGRVFDTKTSGFGDLKLSALKRVRSDDKSTSHIGLGLSFPTGSIEERGATPMNASAKLAYPMQLGSGTFDIQPSYTVIHSSNQKEFGFQAKTTVRMGRNDQGYTLGDKWELTGWLRNDFHEKGASFVRLLYEKWGNIEGRDWQLNPGMSPAANPDFRGGEALFAGVGLEWILGKGKLGIEYLFPLEQRLDGLQMSQGDRFIIGYRASF